MNEVEKLARALCRTHITALYPCQPKWKTDDLVDQKWSDRPWVEKAEALLAELHGPQRELINQERVDARN